MGGCAILSFDPKNTDVDEHIDLINTLGDMVDQKEEAKMEKFIETMPTMIQTHLITCKDWADIKDTAKSLEHMIQKCDPPTPALPLMATGATVLGLYSHIVDSVDKEEGEIPQPFKGAKPEVEVNLKENLKNKDRTHLKPKRQMKLIHMIALTIIIIMIIIMPQLRAEATDPFMVKAVTNNLEVSHNETEAKDLSTINISFGIIDPRKVHSNRTVLNTAITVNPIFREIKQIATETKAMARVLSNSEDTVVVGPIIRVAMELTSISITCMTHRQNSMAHLAVYVVVLIILLSIVTKENMI